MEGGILHVEIEVKATKRRRGGSIPPHQNRSGKEGTRGSSPSSRRNGVARGREGTTREPLSLRNRCAGDEGVCPVENVVGAVKRGRGGI